jgi:hypothetical protein
MSSKILIAHFGAGTFAGALIAWSQIIAPGPSLDTIDRVVIGIAGLLLMIAGGWGAYTVARDKQ